MRRKALPFAFFLLLAATTGCGKRGALVYPDQLLPAAPSVLLLEQTEDKLRLTFSVPKQDRRDKPLQNPVQSMVVLKKDNCSPRDKSFIFAKRFDAAYPGYDSQIVWIDEQVQKNGCYQYRVGAVTSDEEISSFSDTLLVTLQATPAVPVIAVHPIFGGMVSVKLAEKGSQAGKPFAFRLYRADEVNGEFIPLGGLIPADNPFIDQSVQVGKRYSYKARLILKDENNGMYRESGFSNPISVMVQEVP